MGRVLGSLPPPDLTITHPAGVPGGHPGPKTEERTSVWFLVSDTLGSNLGYPVCLLCDMGQIIKRLGNSVFLSAKWVAEIPA